MSKKALDLAEECTLAARSGTDFPTIWETILRRHPMVVGAPVQRLADGKPQLQIALATHQDMVWKPDRKSFAIE